MEEMVHPRAEAPLRSPDRLPIQPPQNSMHGFEHLTINSHMHRPEHCNETYACNTSSNTSRNTSWVHAGGTPHDYDCSVDASDIYIYIYIDIYIYIMYMYGQLQLVYQLVLQLVSQFVLQLKVQLVLQLVLQLV